MTSEFFPKERPRISPTQRALLAINLDNPNTFSFVIQENLYLLRQRDITNKTLLIYAVQKEAWKVVQCVIEKFSEIVFDNIHVSLQLRLGNLSSEAHEELRDLVNFDGDPTSRYQKLTQKLMVAEAFKNLMESVSKNIKNEGNEMGVDVESPMHRSVQFAVF